MTEVIKEFNIETYKPLQYGLTIKKSKVHGLGLFATEDIKAGHDFGETHVFVVNNNRREWVRTPLGGFINHNEIPNCYINTESEDRTLYTVRPIKKGEEITVYYRFETYDGLTGESF